MQPSTQGSIRLLVVVCLVLTIGLAVLLWVMPQPETPLMVQPVPNQIHIPDDLLPRRSALKELIGAKSSTPRYAQQGSNTQ